MRKTFGVLRLPLLFTLMISFALVAAVIWGLFGVRYAVRVELPLNGEVQTYKDADPTLRSVNALKQFAQVRGLSSSPDVVEFEFELSRGTVGPINISHDFSVLRANLRELPDTLAASVASKNENASNIVISATASSSERALDMARMAMDFVRYVLVRRSLIRSIDEWRHFGSSIADLDSEVLNDQSSIASLDRSIAAMTTLRDGYQAATAAAPVNSAVQVQVSGSTFLPPDQQIVGMQSLKIATLERLARKQDELERKKATKSFGDEMATIVEGQPDPLKALDQAETRTDELRAQAQSVPVQQAANVLRSRLATIKAKYVDMETNPPQPFAVRTGMGWLNAIVIGAGIGLITWVGMLYFSLLWRRPQPEAPTSETSRPSVSAYPQERSSVSLAS